MTSHAPGRGAQMIVRTRDELSVFNSSAFEREVLH
jgi:hypothetical protein